MRSCAAINLYHDADARTSVTELWPCLVRSFPQVNVRTVATGEFLASLDNINSVAVLPGIGGEDCAYSQLIGEEGFAKIEKFVEAGGLLLTFCAGSYSIARRTHYCPPWGAIRSGTNARPLFNAVAYGPIFSKAKRPLGSGRYDDTTVMQISYKAADGSWRNTGIAYGNGPALQMDVNDHTVETLAVYEGPAKSIAAASRRIGDGQVLWFGVLPYMGYVPLDVTQVEGHMFDFVESLKPCESGRADFWSMIVARVNQHMVMPRKQIAINPAQQKLAMPC